MSEIQTNSCDVCVIGAGPAGMMASIFAARSGAKVILIEKNFEAGRKLLVTGKGRCNLTNVETEAEKFLGRFGQNGKFLRSAWNFFDSDAVIEFFKSLGITTQVERGGRVFPLDGNALQVREALLSEIKRLPVQVLYGAEISHWKTEGTKVAGARLTNPYGSFLNWKNLIIATGGLSYPALGSDGDGFKWAAEWGHRVVPTRPALTPLLVRESWVKDLEGLSLKNVSLSVWQNGRKQGERFGEALFTAQGLSGPIVLDLSKKVGELSSASAAKIFLSLDLKPALDFQVLDQRIAQDLKKNAAKLFKNSLDELLPAKLIQVVVKLSAFAVQKKAGELTRAERKKLTCLLKDFRLEFYAMEGYNKAIVTAGGVNLREIDPRTLRSRFFSNLFFAGEVLDLDGPTGGYNLQVAWMTGALAGESAARS